MTRIFIYMDFVKRDTLLFLSFYFNPFTVKQCMTVQYLPIITWFFLVAFSSLRAVAETGQGPIKQANQPQPTNNHMRATIATIVALAKCRAYQASADPKPTTSPVHNVVLIILLEKTQSILL